MDERQLWDKAVRGPGKFEGEQPWIAYFYEVYMCGDFDDDYGRTIRHEVRKEDVDIFPELTVGESIYWYERDDGFVCEVDGPGDDDFENSLGNY